MDNYLLDGLMDNDVPTITRIVLHGTFYLSEEDILDVLKHKSIMVHGRYYEVPREELLRLLLNKEYGEIKLELTQIK